MLGRHGAQDEGAPAGGAEHSCGGPHPAPPPPERLPVSHHPAGQQPALPPPLPCIPCPDTSQSLLRWGQAHAEHCGLLQMVPAEGELHSHMHITPLRSSRALALRFLANKFGLDMTNFTVSPAAAP